MSFFYYWYFINGNGVALARVLNKMRSLLLVDKIQTLSYNNLVLFLYLLSPTEILSRCKTRVVSVINCPFDVWLAKMGQKHKLILLAFWKGSPTQMAIYVESNNTYCRQVSLRIKSFLSSSTDVPPLGNDVMRKLSW